jgi:hypothetical protein
MLVRESRIMTGIWQVVNVEQECQQEERALLDRYSLYFLRRSPGQEVEVEQQVGMDAGRTDSF